MDSQTIIKVLDKLIGKTRAIGDSAVDEDRKVNLRALIDVTNWCLDGLRYSANDRHAFEWSVKDNGETAFATMLQLRDWLNEVVEEE